MIFYLGHLDFKIIKNMSAKILLYNLFYFYLGAKILNNFIIKDNLIYYNIIKM